MQHVAHIWPPCCNMLGIVSQPHLNASHHDPTMLRYVRPRYVEMLRSIDQGPINYAQLVYPSPGALSCAGLYSHEHLCGH